MIDANHLRDLAVVPACELLGIHSLAAEQLLMGTVAHESACGLYLRQKTGAGYGAAHGIFQMEKITHQDHVKWIRDHSRFSKPIEYEWGLTYWSVFENIVTDLKLAAVFCRIHYYNRTGPLPTDLIEQAQCWKAVYNTNAGAGTVEQYLEHWEHYIASANIYGGLDG